MGAETKAAAAGAAATQTEEVSLLDKMLTNTKPLDDREKERNKDYIAEFLRQVVKPGQTVSKDVEATIKYWIGAIDNKLSSQMNEVMHSPEFQKLEGAWRGLHYLVHQTETSDTLKIRVL